jgi:hypothetical protein
VREGERHGGDKESGGRDKGINRARVDLSERLLTFTPNFIWMVLRKSTIYRNLIQLRSSMVSYGKRD